jgi:hypothetical protein
MTMTSTTFTHWHCSMTTTCVVCAQQAAYAKKVCFRGLCIDGDVGP